MPPRAVVRARAANARQSHTGITKRAKRTTERPIKWDTGEFVAVDGEGFSEGEEFEIEVGAKSNRYRGKPHHYAYIAASDGSELYSERGRLGLRQLLEFLFAIVERNPNAILVAFGGSYDVCHMVCHELKPEQLLQLLGKGDQLGRLTVTIGEYVYRMEYRPRKCFTVQRWPKAAKRWQLDKKGRKVSTPHATVRLWDVWGFFQDSFAGVLRKWVPDDPDYQFIARMKGERSLFERSEIEEIRRYNAAELRCLVKVMQKLRDAIDRLGLKITRWDGAGAIAAALMTKHKVKSHKADLPEDVLFAARCAYSGGHIEAVKIGFHCEAVHHYDVNSAYPDQFRRLPSLVGGHWVKGNDSAPPPGFTLVRVQWAFPDGLPFYPLFYRCSNGEILYPHCGVGWYWFDEYAVAARYYAQSIEQAPDRAACEFRVLDWYHFRAASDERPFAWVEDYYAQRQDYIRADRARGYSDGVEKIIKLGCNSLYGKTAQQVGARLTEDGELRLPPFFNLAWAGYVTAGCRAKLMAAAIQNPRAIISFATDGIFSTEPLDLYCPKEKELGAWEYQTHDGMTNVMPGVYWLHDGDSVKHYSRGFRSDEMSDAEIVHDAWRRKQDKIPIDVTRLIGIGTAANGKAFWPMRGCFVTSPRSLALNGNNSKRYAINLRQCKPHRGLVDTVPKAHELPHLLGIPDSAPYPVAWIDGVIERDELEGEKADDLEALDAELA